MRWNVCPGYISLNCTEVPVWDRNTNLGTYDMDSKLSAVIPNGVIVVSLRTISLTSGMTFPPPKICQVFIFYSYLLLYFCPFCMSFTFHLNLSSLFTFLSHFFSYLTFFLEFSAKWHPTDICPRSFLPTRGGGVHTMPSTPPVHLRPPQA